MSILRVYLSPFNNGSLRVITEPFSETDSTLPFGGLDNRRITMLKALNAERFDPDDFPDEDEQKWMIAEKLLVGEGNQRSFHSDLYKNIGRELYKSLFPPGSTAESILQRERYLAKTLHEQLHLQIAIKEDVARQARLFDYPWELLCDEQRRFLASQGIAISRYIEYNDPLPDIPALEQINVLLVSSRAIDPDPDVDLKPLNDDEYQAAYQALQKAAEEELLQLDELEHVTVKSLENYLIEHRGKNTPYIIHFDGHGHFGGLCKHNLPEGRGECGTFHPGILTRKCKKCGAELANPQGYLLFEGGSRGYSYISAGHIGSILGLANQSNQPGRGIALVVLSACKSSMAQAEDSVFNGVAQSLISQQIPAVVGMAFTVNTASTTNFAEKFYRALGGRLPLALAMNWGRLAMEDTGYEGNQWYRPALYLRWKDNEGGQIFATLPETASTTEHSEKWQTTDQIDSNGQNLSKPSDRQVPADVDKEPKQLDVLTLAINYYNDIEVKQKQLLPVFLLFSVIHIEDIRREDYRLVAESPLFGIDDIWPEHCEFALLLLQKMVQPIQKFYDLLDKALSNEFKEEVVRLRSGLMTPLRVIGDRLANLISLIARFRDVCRTISGDSLKREIRDNLSSLQENLNKIKNPMDI